MFGFVLSKVLLAKPLELWAYEIHPEELFKNCGFGHFLITVHR